MKTYVKYHSHRKVRGPVIQSIWNMFLKRRLLVGSFIILLVVLPIVVMTFQYTKTSEAAWFDDSWSFRKAISIPSHSIDESNVYVTAPTFDATDATKFQSDCGDIRFTNQKGESLPYFVVSCNASANIHVLFESLPAGANTYYMYYGNPAAQNGFTSIDFATAATGLGSQTLASEEQSQAPIAYWKFDEGYGTTVNDSTKNANNGAFGASTAAPTWQSEDQCIAGKCLYFDGSDDVVNVANSSSLQVIGDQTIAMWLKPIMLGARRNPIAKAYGGEGTITFEPGNSLNYYWGTGGGNANPYESKNSSTGLILNQWNQIVLVRNISANTITWYINGRQTSQGVPGYAAAVASTLPLTIGKGYAGGFNGYIDEVKIYSYARTYGQIKADFSLKGSSSTKGSAVSMGTNVKNNETLSKGLLAYWKSDEASGNGADSSGNTNTTTVSGTNNYSTGKFGNGLRTGVATTNLVTNPSAETGLSSWGNWQSNNTRVTSNKMFGQYSVQSTKSVGLGYTGFTVDNVVPGVSPSQGQTYTCSFYIKTDLPWVGKSGSIVIRESGGLQASGQSSTAITHTASWQRVSVSRTIVEADRTTLDCYVFMSGVLDNDAAYFYSDGFQVELASAATSYVDGSLGTGYSWSGTAHASTSTRTASAATNATLLNNTSGSLSFWFNSPSLDTSAQCPLGASDGDNTGGLFFGLKNSGIYLTHNYATSQTVTPQYAANINNNTWYHVAYTWDAPSRQGNLYVNGLLQQSINYPQTITIGEYIQNLGTCTRTGYAAFNGTLDDIRDYNRALTPDEVYKLSTWTPGPLAHFGFEEATGPTVNDLSGNGLNATWAGSSNHYTSGIYGKAGNFPTNSDYAYSNNSSFNMGTNDFTISTWIKTSNASRAYIIDKGAGDGLNGYRFETNVDFKLVALIGGPSGYIAVSGNKVINDGKWHFVSVVFARNGNAQIYVDGATSGNPVDISAFNGVNITNASNFAIGSNGGGAGVRYIGAIDEVYVYNYAQTLKQIVQDMNANHPLGGSPIGSQVVYWKFDEGYGDVANNTGNGGPSLNGDLAGACPGAATCPTWDNSGKFGKALAFNGSQYLSNTGTINNVQTISYWVNANSVDEMVMDLGNNAYIRSNGFLSGLVNANATTYIDGVQEALGSEIVTNGNMEAGNPPTGWSPSAGTTITSVTDERTGGSGATSMNVAGTDQTWVSPITGGALTSGSLYRVSGWLKAVPTYNSTAGIIIANSSFVAITNSSYTGTTWQKSTLHFIAQPTTYRYLTLGGVITRYGQYDDISIKQIKSVIPANSWHNVTIVLDAPITVSNLTIGKVGTAYFNGKLDEVKLYSAALTPDEIRINNNRGSSIAVGSGDSSANGKYCVPGSLDSCASPVGEWNFEEKTGQTVNDISGNGNLATLGVNNSIGADDPTWTSGKIGSGLSFDGGDRVNLGNGSSLNPTGQITMSAWIYPTTFVGAYRRIIDKGYNAQYHFSFGNTDPTTYLYCGLSISGVWRSASFNNSVNINRWQYVSCTYDGDKIRVYVDGNLGATSPSYPGTIDVSANNATVGSNPSGGENFIGKIDDVRIYDYARTPAQISWDNNQGKPVAYFKLDECQGTIANDSSGNGNTGTITIGATVPQSSVGTCIDGLSTSAWNNGKVGKYNASMSFDGVDDEITTADSPSLDMANMTVSAWIKTSNAAEQCIVERNNSTFYFCTNAGKLRYWINGVAATWMTSNKSVNDGVWHHVLGTWDGTNKKLYIDGNLDKTEAGTGGDMGSTTVGLNIGVRKTAGVPQFYFNGQIDDVKLFNYAQTESQIKQQSNDGSAVRFGPATGSP